MRILHLLCLATTFFISGFISGQSSFPSDPMEAEFVTGDIPRFWEAFDEFESSGGNPFKEYIDKGSQGLQDFIPYRIESAGNLRKTVKKRKDDYAAIREESFKVLDFKDQIRGYYQNLKEIYEPAIFPPAYFVVGAFNSGGTSSPNGIIMGVEMQQNMANVPYIVAHELIHYNQDYDLSNNTLLKQSIMEGSADLIGEMISGKNSNEAVFRFGEEHEQELCLEFVKIMDQEGFQGWLYGTKGKKEGRPNDLGYWIGYKICAAYYEKARDKKQALADILNIRDFDAFLATSGYLDPYLKE